MPWQLWSVSEIVVEGLATPSSFTAVLVSRVIACLLLLKVNSAGVVPSKLERMALPTNFAVST